MLRTLSKILVVLILGTTIGFNLPSFSSVIRQSLTGRALNSFSTKGNYRGIVRLVNTENRFFCTATVISDTEALSASHCFNHLQKNEFVVQSTPAADGSVVVGGAYVIGINIRGDTALIRGDFKDFDKFKLETDPEKDILVSDYELVTCGFPYGGKLVCYEFTNPYKLVDVIGGKGQMYAGMSGGPVIDLKSGKIVAVNHAVTERAVIVAPIVNLFDGLMRIGGN